MVLNEAFVVAEELAKADKSPEEPHGEDSKGQPSEVAAPSNASLTPAPPTLSMSNMFEEPLSPSEAEEPPATAKPRPETQTPIDDGIPEELLPTHAAPLAENVCGTSNLLIPSSLLFD